MAEYKDYKYGVNIIHADLDDGNIDLDERNLLEIFVGYLVEQLEKVELLKTKCKQTCYLPSEDLLPGRNVLDENINVLESSWYTFIIFSQHFLKSAWSKYQRQMSQLEHLDTKRLIPIAIRGVTKEQIPKDLCIVEPLIFTNDNWNKFSAGVWKRLLKVFDQTEISSNDDEVSTEVRTASFVPPHKESYQEIEEILSSDKFNLRGEDMRGRINIAVFDSGICTTHSAFEKLVSDKLIVKKDYTGGTDATDSVDKDVSGHGTAVSAIIAGNKYRTVWCRGNKKNIFYQGLAPFSKLFVYKVFDKKGKTCIAKLVEALEDLDQLKDEKGEEVKIDIINLSMAFQFTNLVERKNMQKIISELSQKYVVVCAASNEGMRDTNTILYPAAFGCTICVGSHNCDGVRSSFSAIGQQLDFLGPGERATAPRVNSKGEKEIYHEFKGTSYATSYITGVVAQLLLVAEILGEEDGNNKGQGKALRELLTNTYVMKKLLCEIATNSGHKEKIGYGKLKPWEKLLQFSKVHILRVLLTSAKVGCSAVQ